jgi:hypothetical protein
MLRGAGYEIAISRPGDRVRDHLQHVLRGPLEPVARESD